MSETTTETKVTDIDSAVNSIVEPVQEEPIEEAPVEDVRETEEISADADIDLDIELEDDNTEEEVEEIEASDSEDDDDLIEDASPSEPSMYTVKVDGRSISTKERS